MSSEASAPTSYSLATGEMREPQPPLSTAARATFTAMFFCFSAEKQFTLAIFPILLLEGDR